VTVIGPFEFRVSYICSSSDTKPTENVPKGSGLYETDTGKTYWFDGIIWIAE
jgi:hypothetical protein